MEHPPAPPPAYDSDLAEDLPAYSGPAVASSSHALQNHVFGAKGLNGKTIVAELILVSPKLSKNLPAYLEGMPVAGRVILYLTGPETIQEIQGLICPISKGWVTEDEKTRFLDIGEKIYAPEAKDSKLTGRQEWAFHVNLPSEVFLPFGPNQSVETFRLPETSTEPNLFHSISYEVTLLIRRSRFKRDYRVSTNIGIIPSIRPDPPSMLRRLAYQENTPILGPDLDPEGWHAIEPVTVRGRVFNVRSIDVKCTLSLAKPLSYTRGSVIPLHLLLESEDKQALDLVSSPESPVLRLRRVVKHRGGTAVDMDAPSWKDLQNDYHLASFLPITNPGFDSEPPQGKFKRQLYGEVHLDIGLKPTTSIANVELFVSMTDVVPSQYFIVLFPFKSAGFEPESTASIATVPVEIATLHATGPRPRKYAPLRDDNTPAPLRYNVTSTNAFM